VLIKRAGMSLVEVVAAVLIVALLAAAVYPTIAAQWRRGQSAALASQLGNLRDALEAYRDNVTRYPRTVSQLNTALGVTATDACGATMSPGIRNKWRGPYLSQNVSGEIPVGDATVKDTFVRVPPTDAGTAPGILRIRVINVDTLAAIDVERQFDGAEQANFGSGNVLWSTAGSDTLWFQISIRNC